MEEYNKELEEKQLELEECRKKAKIYKKLTIFQLVLLFLLIGTIIIIYYLILNMDNSYNEQAYSLSKAETAIFNNQFLKYEGVQKGSIVKALINEVIASNDDPNHQPDLLVSVTLGEINMSSSEITTEGIDTKKKYNIEFLYSGKDERKIVNEIIITPMEEEE